MGTYDPFRVILGEEIFQKLIDIFPTFPKKFDNPTETQHQYQTEMEEVITRIQNAWDYQPESQDSILQLVHSIKTLPDLPDDFEVQQVIDCGWSLILPHHKSTLSEIG